MTYPTLNQPPSLAHLERMTDCFGLIQHANYSVPNLRTGYTTDDNARALVVALKHRRLYGDGPAGKLAYRYLAFLTCAQRPDGRFHNFFSYQRTPLDEVGSEDSFARAVWALAHVLADPDDPLADPAERLLHEALPWIENLEHPRSRAYCLTALHRWVCSERGDAPRARRLARPLADYLLQRYREHSRPGWDWILPEFTYANAALPEALFRAHQLLGDESYLRVARRTMEFLVEQTTVGDVLATVGNQEWLQLEPRELPARYDQQPIEAGVMVEASLAAYETTGEMIYLDRAQQALEWFFGRNLQALSLHDPETTGCFDALTETGVNRNQGAESVVALLMAQLVMAEAPADVPDPAVR